MKLRISKIKKDLISSRKNLVKSKNLMRIFVTKTKSIVFVESYVIPG